MAGWSFGRIRRDRLGPAREAIESVKKSLFAHNKSSHIVETIVFLNLSEISRYDTFGVGDCAAVAELLPFE